MDRCGSEGFRHMKSFSRIRSFSWFVATYRVTLSMAYAQIVMEAVVRRVQ